MGVGIYRQSFTRSPSNNKSAFLLVFFTTLSCFAQLNWKCPPESITLELGKKAHSLVFEYRNIGSTNIAITNVQSGCDCNEPKYSNKPIKPGESGELTLKIDERDPFALFERYTLLVNTSDGTRKELTGRLEYASPVSLEPWSITWKKEGAIRTMVSKITPTNGAEDVRLTNVVYGNTLHFKSILKKDGDAYILSVNPKQTSLPVNSWVRFDVEYKYKGKAFSCKRKVLLGVSKF